MESSYLHNPENIKPKEPTLEEVRSNLYREMSIKEPQAVEYSLDEIPSEEAKLQNTKTFKDWYHGPVDDKGNPKMFWHSTGDYFLKFNPDFMYRGRGFLNLGAGFYLGEDKTPLSFYKDIAKQKIPDDENRKIKIENLNTRMSRIQSIASHMKKKASVETNQEYKLIEALLSEEEILRKDRLDFIKENPNYTNYAYDESISQLKKRYLKRIFDNTYRKIYELHSHGEELRAKRNVQYKIASEKEGKLKKIVEKEKNLLNKLRSVIDSLMPEGATLRCYANIDKILDFNESVDKTVITNIRQALERNDYEISLFDQQVSQKETVTGQELYHILTHLIEEKELKHHLSIPRGEEPVQTKNVLNFLKINNLFDAHVYEEKKVGATSHGGKTLIVYDENDILISPFYEK